MDEDLNLNDSPNLPDGTASANGGGAASMGGLPSSALKNGFVSEGEKLPTYDEDITGENVIGNAADNPGFCGRPQGWAR